MPEFRLESHPAAQSYRLLDFESVEVSGGFVNDTYFLTVRGTTPCINMKVSLSPLIYIRCPEYWGIEVVGHLPHGICLDAIGHYEETIELTGITGSRGIEVIGATRTEIRDVPGGCDDSRAFSARAAEGGEQFIVIALTASDGEKHKGCRVVPDGSPYARIYSQVFGPASREECEKWIADNCGFDGGDPPE
jgi:hypothetical protein